MERRPEVRSTASVRASAVDGGFGVGGVGLGGFGAGGAVGDGVGVGDTVGDGVGVGDAVGDGFGVGGAVGDEVGTGAGGVAGVGLTCSGVWEHDLNLPYVGWLTSFVRAVLLPVTFQHVNRGWSRIGTYCVRESSICRCYGWWSCSMWSCSRWCCRR